MANNTSLYGSNGNVLPAGDNVIITGTLTVNGCSILTDCSAFNLLPFNANTLNIGLESTTLALGSTSGVTTVRNQLATGNYAFPVADGTANQILVTDGSGNLSFASVGSLGVVTSITGTANQVIVSNPTGAVTLSLPQDIAITSGPQFASVTGGNIRVGGTTDNTIDTITGDLFISSATNLVNVDAGLDVDSGVLYVDATNNRVGINNTSPLYELHIDQGLDGVSQFAMTTSERTALLTMNDTDDLLSLSYGPFFAINRLQFSPTDQWFNSGRLGVGTATPAYELDVQGTGSFSSDLQATGGFTLRGLTSGQTVFSQSATGSNIGYLLPTAQGAAATVLTNDGSGNLSWALPGGGGSTFGNITIAVADDNTISTTTGNLKLTSATSIVDINAVVNITGDYLNLNSDNNPFNSAIRFNGGSEIIFDYAEDRFEISKDLYIPSNLELDGNFTINGSTSGYSRFAAPATGSNLSYILPGSAGAANTVLTNDGSGNLTWALPGGGGSTFGNITVGVVTDNTISTTTGNLVLASATNVIDASTAEINVNVLTVDNRSSIESTTQTTTSISPVSIIDTARAVMKCVVSVVDNVTGERQALEALLLEQGTTAYLTTYAEMNSGVVLATFTADVNAGLLRLIATPTSTNSTTFNVVRTSLD